MRKVTINDCSDTGKWVEYATDGIRLINDVRQIPRPNLDAVTVDMIVINVCIQGKSTVYVNGKKHTQTSNEMLILLPNDTIGTYKCSDDFKCSSLQFSLENIEDGILFRRRIWNCIDFLHQHPVLSLTADDLQVLYHYSGIIDSNHRFVDDVYLQEIVTNLLKSVVYEFLLIVERKMLEEGGTDNLNKPSSNYDLYRRFMELLAFSKGNIRQVSQYAEQLCVTPKQLSAVVKASSGRTVVEWINESTIKAITNELRYTQKSVSEIAHELGFPSLSFFGKYFKQHTGLSPRAYREQLEESVP